MSDDAAPDFDARLDAAARVGKRLSTSDPLGPHDVAERLDHAALRVWRIIVLAEEQGPDYVAAVLGSRYLTNALPDLRGIIQRFVGGTTEGEVDPVTVDAVAWALFAGGDATYLAGDHVPDETERELAALLVRSLRLRGYDVTPRV